MVKNLPAMWETWVPSLGWDDPLEKVMATHSSILSLGERSLASYSPWGFKRVGHDWVTKHSTDFLMIAILTSERWYFIIILICIYFPDDQWCWASFHGPVAHLHSALENCLVSSSIQSMEFSRPEYWLHSLSILQGIFPTQRSSPGLLYCKQILYQLSHKGNPIIPDWVAYPFSSGSS